MYVAGNFEAENSLIHVVTMVIGQHSRVTVHYYPLTSQILQCCLHRDFGVKHYHCKMSCDLEVTSERVLYNNINDHLRENALIFLLILPINSLRNYEDQNLFFTRHPVLRLILSPPPPSPQYEDELDWIPTHSQLRLSWNSLGDVLSLLLL